MQSKHNICVTGSTSGIGYSIVENLAKRAGNGYNIFITSRKLQNAQAVIQKLTEAVPDTGSTFTALELDLSNKGQIDAFVASLVEKNIKFDILVNNAGINKFEEANQSKDAFDLQWNVNYVHTRYFIEQVLEKDLIQRSGKLINVSSELGKFLQFKDLNPQIYDELQKADSYSYQQIAELEKIFLEDQESEEKRLKWPDWVYSSSKMFLNLYTITLSKDPIVADRNIQVYAMCPGWCKTRLTARDGNMPPRTSDEGAQTVLHLIDLPFEVNQELQGGFFEREKKTSYDSEPTQYF